MGPEISYLDKIGKGNIKMYYSLLSEYKHNFTNAASLSNEYPIFFDTNILLRTYSISFKAREKLLGFFTANKNRIYLTNQVQLEFIKNREDIINRFFDNVTNKIPNDFKNEIISHIGAYLERNKIILKDYLTFETALNKIKSDCEILQNDLIKDIEARKQENYDLIFTDKHLEIISGMKHLDPLSLDCINNLKQEFDSLSKNIDIEKISSELNKAGRVFPGMADLKQKPENPYGDFIIFNEVASFARKEKKHVIFLTYDTAKGDWIGKDGNPHLHYIENFYLNTNQLIYILDAERVLEELLNISFESLIQVKEEDVPVELITYNSLVKFLEERYPNCDPTSFSEADNLLKEIFANGYKTIKELESDLDRSDIAFKFFLEQEEGSMNRFTRGGNVRLRLRTIINDYKYLNKFNEIYKLPNNDMYRKYNEFVK